MATVARPWVVGQVPDHAGPKRVALDVAKNSQRMLIDLNDGTLEAALPDMAAAGVAAMVAPCMRHGERLKNSADRLALGWFQEQVKMVAHQTVAAETEWVAPLRLNRGMQKSALIGSREEDTAAVIAAIDGMIHKAIGHRTQRSAHGRHARQRQTPTEQKKGTDTDFPPGKKVMVLPDLFRIEPFFGSTL
jgi:hypothetical protein